MMTDVNFLDLVGVISTKGHYIDQEYITKEMALKCFGDDKPMLFHFYNEDKPWQNLKESDKLLISYIHDTTFDIKYDKYWFGMFHPSSIQYLLQVCKQDFPPEAYDPERAYNPIDITIGYYGGAFERAILDLIGVKGIDLTDYGCPDANQLKTQYTNNNIDIDFAGCGLHTNPNSDNCCKVDVLLYEHWVLNDVYTPDKCVLHKHYKSKNIFNFINLERDLVKPF